MRLLIPLTFLFAIVANGETYYVTDSAEGRNDCLSWESSCTLTKLNDMVKAGDTIIVREGDYPTYHNYFKPKNGGTPDNPITITSENGVGSITRHAGWADIKVPYVVVKNIGCHDLSGACVNITDTHHVTVDGIIADRCWRGVSIRNSHHNVVKNSVFLRNKEGLYIEDGSNHNLIQNNVSVYNGMIQPKGDRCGLCVGGHGAGHHNTLDGNFVAFNGGEGLADYGIAAYDAQSTTITNNIVRDNNHGGIMVTQFSRDSLVKDNLVERNGRYCERVTNLAGISIRNASSDTVVSGNIVKDNCVSAGNPWGDTAPRGALDVRGWPPAEQFEPIENVLFIDNVVTGTIGGPDYFVDPSADTSNIRLIE